MQSRWPRFGPKDLKLVFKTRQVLHQQQPLEQLPFLSDQQSRNMATKSGILKATKVFDIQLDLPMISISRNEKVFILHLTEAHVTSRTHEAGAAACPTARIYVSEIRAASNRASELQLTQFKLSANNWSFIPPVDSKNIEKATMKNTLSGQPCGMPPSLVQAFPIPAASLKHGLTFA